MLPALTFYSPDDHPGAIETKDPLHAIVNFSRLGCPSHPDTQERILALVEAVSKRHPWASIVLDGLGFPASPDGDFYKSICFCPACMYGYGPVGMLLEEIAKDPPMPQHPSVNTLLLWRRSVQYGILQQLRPLTKIPLWLHTAADIRYTGPKSSLAFEETAGLIDAFCIAPEDGERLKSKLPVYYFAFGSIFVPGPTVKSLAGNPVSMCTSSE